MVMISLGGLTDEDAARFEGGDGGGLLRGRQPCRPDQRMAGDDGVARDSHHGYLQFKEYASIGFNFSF